MDQKQVREIVKYFFLTLTILSYLIVIGYIFQNFTNPNPTQVNLLMALPGVLFLVPYLFLSLFEVKRVENKMEVVPRFFRDVVDNVESGTDLVSSIINTTKNEYGVLNEDIKKLSNQLSWGVEFDKAMLNFAANIGSKDLERDLRLVIEARNVGGHVEKILRELSQKISTEILRIKERKSNLSSNTFTGYLSFLIFVGIIILVYNNLFLELGGGFGGTDAETAQIQDLALELYLTLFTLLAYELAILSGFLFGLMQENNLISGAPHVVVLILMVFVGFFVFI